MVSAECGENPDCRSKKCADEGPHQIVRFKCGPKPCASE